MLARAKTREERIVLLQHAIDGIVGTFYNQVLFADFELEAHRLVESDQPITSETLSGIYARAARRVLGRRAVARYARAAHLGAHPAFLPVAVLRLSIRDLLRLDGEVDGGDRRARTRRSRAAAVDRYLELLRRADRITRWTLLKRAGVDLSKPETVRAVSAQLDGLVDRLEGARRKEPEDAKLAASRRPQLDAFVEARAYGRASWSRSSRSATRRADRSASPVAPAPARRVPRSPAARPARPRTSVGSNDCDADTTGCRAAARVAARRCTPMATPMPASFAACPTIIVNSCDGSRAERQPHADFARPLADDQRHHAVDADRCQAERQHAERADDQQDESARGHRLRAQRRHGPHVVERQVLVDAPRFRADRLRQRAGSPVVRSTMNGDTGGPCR